MQSHKIVFGILVTVIASMVVVVYMMTNAVTLATAQQQATSSMKSTVVRDSATILLQDKTISAKGFIHLYDATSLYDMGWTYCSKSSL
jgi:hypothetical protein